MPQVSVNIRMDRELKKEFESFCSEMGMSMTTAFTIFAKKTVREERIPFEIGFEYPNGQLLKAIENVEKGKNLSRTFYSIKDLMEDLDAGDSI
ncbi:type II toxin-antitoxin system RelB/DinJ family antitoxin [uncultured Dubosiella sp.]|uniref:type II toxin-antitoxin system RelB/DinJ family antitoxin n=1 Tax=uncultured Dubosiella sp. TaxID=1937011 RepID=UPI00208528BA|nr:type II toxin-antitoxin system RelB/DinJ family antitoxin [uncultured Dubosiella sp.]GJM57154.1 hypothetical protein EROP_08470 [Erysipelotrichaceae bacterium OPF54]